MKSLHAIKNYNTLLASPLNIGGLATSIFDLLLDQGITASPPPPSSLSTNNAYNATIYSCCCLI